MGQCVVMTEQDWRAKTALLKSRLAKFNPYHDERGRFSSADRATTGHANPAPNYQVAQLDRRGWPAGTEYHNPSNVSGKRWLVMAAGDTDEMVGPRSGEEFEEFTTEQEAIDQSYRISREYDARRKKRQRAKRRKNPYPGGRSLKAWRASGMTD